MKISIRDQIIEFRLVGIYSMTHADEGARIHAEGYWFPSPNVESGLAWSMTFDEAQRLRDQLSKAIEETECPHCHRKAKP